MKGWKDNNCERRWEGEDSATKVRTREDGSGEEVFSRSKKDWRRQEIAGELEITVIATIKGKGRKGVKAQGITREVVKKVIKNVRKGDIRRRKYVKSFRKGERIRENTIGITITTREGTPSRIRNKKQRRLSTRIEQEIRRRRRRSER